MSEKAYKIGVGVITMGVRPIKNYHLSEESELFVYTDHEKKGPGHARNQCLKYFDEKDYEHIFLFDDDCYPVRLGWENYFITQAEKFQISYIPLPDVFNGEFLLSSDEMSYWYSALGCFTYRNKKCLEATGGYNTEYVRYGYEDAAMSRRATKAGLTGHEKGWGFPVRGLSYIHSEDVYGENPVANINMQDKLEYIKQNGPIYTKEIQSEQLFYEFRK